MSATPPNRIAVPEGMSKRLIAIETKPANRRDEAGSDRRGLHPGGRGARQVPECSDFTLIELLVIMGIIAILAALLLQRSPGAHRNLVLVKPTAVQIRGFASGQSSFLLRLLDRFLHFENEAGHRAAPVTLYSFPILFAVLLLPLWAGLRRVRECGRAASVAHVDAVGCPHR